MTHQESGKIKKRKNNKTESLQTGILRVGERRYPGHFFAIINGEWQRGRDLHQVLHEIKKRANEGKGQCMVVWLPTDSRDYAISDFDGMPEVEGGEVIAMFHFGDK